MACNATILCLTVSVSQSAYVEQTDLYEVNDFWLTKELLENLTTNELSRPRHLKRFLRSCLALLPKVQPRAVVWVYSLYPSFRTPWF